MDLTLSSLRSSATEELFDTMDNFPSNTISIGRKQRIHRLVDEDDKTFREKSLSTKIHDKYVLGSFKLSIPLDDEISRFLKFSPQEKLEISNKRLTQKQWVLIFTVLKEADFLVDINLSYCNLKLNALISLSVLLQDSVNIKKLDLSGIDINLVSAKIFNRLEDTYLVSVCLANCRLDDKDVNSLLTFTKDNAILKNLDLSSNMIEGKQRILRDLLFENTILETLDLSWNHIRKIGCSSLVLGLIKNNSLLTLNLSFNGISDDGIKEITRMLEVNQTLESLNLRDNRITNQGAERLGYGLSVNNTLRKLDISGNMITAVGMQYILVGVIKSGNLQELHMKQISPDTVCMRAINHLQKVSKDILLTYGVPILLHSKLFLKNEDVVIREEIFTEIRNYLFTQRLRMLDLFNMWDKKKTGALDMLSIGEGLQACGIPVTKAILEKLFGLLDHDENRTISYSEFTNIAKLTD
ncbi:leucine-rich repeat-containing protein 74B-like [Clytia hemisphaerica]|uniref:leucine-rich repeat-containing protein 74B-like n=1 Tax=Clytia hemisphaerica TaxID=252671 RepID=UPI0034D6762B|eukprot:TCONS_00006089-protein